MSEDRNPIPRRVPEALTRVGDAERDAAARALGEHFAAGRLEREELDGRLEAAYAARTRADLDHLFADLPAPAGGGGPAATARPYPPRPYPPGFPARRPPVPLLPVAVVLLVVMGVGAARAGIPPFFLLPLLWICLGGWRRAWR